MDVRTLIEKLQALPGELPVMFSYDDDCAYVAVARVTAEEPWQSRELRCVLRGEAA